MILFIDTNILLHYSSLEQVDWKEVCGVDNVRILLSPVVIEELDKHKRNANPKISKRAKNVIRKISETGLIGNWGNSVTIEVITKRPMNETFIKHSLDKEEQDDRLLAVILEFENADNKSLKLLTNDLGPKLKCLSLSIETLSLPEKYELKEEEGELVKEIIKLKEQLNKYESQAPKLSFQFENNKDFYSIKLIKFDFEEIKREKLTKIILENPHMNNPQDPFWNMRDPFINAKSVDSYNSGLDKFYNEYEDYLIESKEHFSKVSLTNAIKFKLSNLGSIPANDIDIKLHFPDGFLLKNEKPRNKNKKPSSPMKPGEIFKSQLIFPLSHAPQTNLIPGITTSAQIKKTNSYDVSFSLKSLKHNQDFIFEEIFLTFDSFDSAGGFQIEYKIYAANIPTVQEGYLNVIVEQ